MTKQHKRTLKTYLLKRRFFTKVYVVCIWGTHPPSIHMRASTHHTHQLTQFLLPMCWSYSRTRRLPQTQFREFIASLKHHLSYFARHLSNLSMLLQRKWLRIKVYHGIAVRDRQYMKDEKIFLNEWRCNIFRSEFNNLSANPFLKWWLSLALFLLHFPL